MHGSHISADILCKLQDLHIHTMCTILCSFDVVRVRKFCIGNNRTDGDSENDDVRFLVRPYADSENDDVRFLVCP